MSAPRTGTTLIDASPGQLYITASGHLYHAGKICIVMAGLPARGKTNRTVSIARYLRWLGVKVAKFHLSDYRRKMLGEESQLPKDYYSFGASVREKLLLAATEDIWQFYAQGGQVALYDAINPLASERRRLAEMCKERGVECLFVECSVTDKTILARNISEINRASPDYAKKERAEAIDLHISKLKQTFAYYEPVDEKELIYIKIQNDGEKIMVNHGPLGYLLNRVLLFNLNSRKRRGSLFFARAGCTGSHTNEDDDLSPQGQRYSQQLFETLVQYMSSEEYTHHDHSGLDPSNLGEFADIHSRAQSPSLEPEQGEFNLSVLSSSRAKAIQTSRPFKAAGFPTQAYSLLTQRKEGQHSPEQMADWERDPYHYSFPRGESFQDVAIRLEPVLLELERIETSVLIIAHESVLAVLFGYFKGLSTVDIPRLEFSGREIVELSSTGAEHIVNRIPVPGAKDGGIVE